jgi:hypothetical protein
VTNGTIRAVTGIGLVAAAIACGPQANTSGNAARSGQDQARNSAPHGEPMPHEQCVAGGGETVQHSVGNDRPTPVVEVRRGGRLYCRETDANFDGRVDITRFFDDQGRVTRVEDDYDFDGKLDVVATYREGTIVSDVLDTNFDGRTDTWRVYEGGRLTRAQRDANSDGIVDMWEEFDARGVATRTLTDTNGDGLPDGEPDAGVRPASAAASSGGAIPATVNSGDAGAQPAATDGGQP